jgi:microcystin-dependent protein
MADTLTPNYNWTKPDVGADASVWGTTLNADLDLIDAQVFNNQTAAIAAGAPIGAGAFWFTATPPVNWLICNGALLSTAAPYDKLFAEIGYTFGGSGANFNLPNLVNRFPMGAGTLAAAGGEASHVLSVAEMPVHAHPIADVAHNHGVNQSPHNHPDPTHGHGASASQDAHNHVVGNTVNNPPGGLTNGGSFFGLVSTATSSAQPNVYVNVAAAGANLQPANANLSLNASGTNLSTTQNAGSGAAHNNLPPYLQLNFIIRYQ